MILIEPPASTSNNCAEGETNSRAAVGDSTNAVINTANALLAISAAFQSTQSRLQQNGSKAATTVAVDTNADGNSSSSDVSLTQSNFGSESTGSDENDMDDLIYKNSPLRHYHNHYRSNLVSTCTSQGSKQNEQASASSATSSPTSSVPLNK